MIYTNGSVWIANYPALWMAVLMVLPNDKWCLINIEEGIPTVITDPDKSGKWTYDISELPKRFKYWKKTDALKSGLLSMGKEEE
jgi:hypothetical protein